MDELIGSFGAEDSQRILSIHESFQAIRASAQASEKSAKDLIRDMTHRVRSLETAATAPEPAGAHDARVAQLQQEIHATQARVDAGHGDLEQRQGTRRAAADRQVALSQEARRIEQAKGHLEDMHRQLALFTHISKMDLDGSAWPAR